MEKRKTRMNRWITMILVSCLILMMTACTRETKDTYVMVGTVTRIEGQSLFVTPVEGSKELQSSDCFCVGVEKDEDFQVGDTVQITYEEGIAEIYPAVFNHVIRVEKQVDQ